MAARWTIINQYPESAYPRGGDVIAGRRFVIREASTGTEDDFWLPVSQLTAEIVTQEAQARADRIEEFSKLGGG